MPVEEVHPTDAAKVAAVERTLRETDPHSPDLPRRIVELAELLRRAAGPSAAPRTVTLFSQASAAAQQDPSLASRIQYGLGGSYRERYGQTHDPKDLDLAVLAGERAVAFAALPA